MDTWENNIGQTILSDTISESHVRRDDFIDISQFKLGPTAPKLEVNQTNFAVFSVARL